MRALAAARARENSKRSEWTKRAEGDGKVVTVVPCVMETTSAVGKDFLDFIRNMEKATANSLGASAAVLWQELQSQFTSAMPRCWGRRLEGAGR